MSENDNLIITMYCPNCGKRVDYHKYRETIMCPYCQEWLETKKTDTPQENKADEDKGRTVDSRNNTVASDGIYDILNELVLSFIKCNECEHMDCDECRKIKIKQARQELARVIESKMVYGHAIEGNAIQRIADLFMGTGTDKVRGSK